MAAKTACKSPHPRRMAGGCLADPQLFTTPSQSAPCLEHWRGDKKVTINPTNSPDALQDAEATTGGVTSQGLNQGVGRSLGKRGTAQQPPQSMAIEPGEHRSVQPKAGESACWRAWLAMHLNASEGVPRNATRAAEHKETEESQPCRAKKTTMPIIASAPRIHKVLTHSCSAGVTTPCSQNERRSIKPIHLLGGGISESMGRSQMKITNGQGYRNTRG